MAPEAAPDAPARETQTPAPHARRPTLIGGDPRELARAIEAMLWSVGENPQRPGLRDTPERAARALADLTAGYTGDAADVVKVFPVEGPPVDEMITVGPIPFFSLCEHHLLPFFGDAWVGYVPSESGILGLSKFARLVDLFARRLQVQERLTGEIADAFNTHVAPRGVGVLLRARHLCMEMRGVGKAGATTTTTALRGVFTEPAARAEFLAAIGR